MRGGTVSAVIEEQRVAKLPQWRQLAARGTTRTAHAEARWFRAALAPESVPAARKHAVAALAEHHILDVADAVEVVVSELVTNGLQCAQAYASARGEEWTEHERPVSLRVICRQRWAHILVVDPDPSVPEPKPAGLLDERGRGLGIVEALAALHWFSVGDHGKTAHAVVTRPNVLLSADEVDMLRRRVIL
jgi:hypothetical protein